MSLDTVNIESPPSPEPVAGDEPLKKNGPTMRDGLAAETPHIRRVSLDMRLAETLAADFPRGFLALLFGRHSHQVFRAGHRVVPQS